MIRWQTVVTWAFTASGTGAILAAVWFSLSGAAPDQVDDLLVFMALGWVLSIWLVKLPGGILLNAGIDISLAAAFLLPWPYALVSPLPAIVTVTLRRGHSWRNALEDTGKAAVALLATRIAYLALAPPGPMELPQHLPAAVAGVLAHELAHLAAATFGVSRRRQVPYRVQLRRSLALDMSWSVVGMRIVGPLLAVQYTNGAWWEFGLLVAVLVCLFRSLPYFARAEMLAQQAYTDALTGVGSRTAFEEQARDIQARNIPGLLLVVDMNGLKAVNDTAGHAVGDEALRDLAASLRAALDRHGKLFRYGGDEFVLFVPWARERDWPHPIEGALVAFQKRWTARGLVLSASIGNAWRPRDGVDLGELFRLADKRMYATKRSLREGMEPALRNHLDV